MCSPGCFSLFRGSALMDDHVLRTYCTKSLEARHYVQYDQGEDRWLCTLLLQEGYRVEYCAASDALTYAPETFHVRWKNLLWSSMKRFGWFRNSSINVVDGFHRLSRISLISWLNTNALLSSTIVFRISISSINCFWWSRQSWVQRLSFWWLSEHSMPVSVGSDLWRIEARIKEFFFRY